MSRFAVTLPGWTAHEREEAAAKLDVTGYLRFGQMEHTNAIGCMTTVEAVRRPDAARDVVVQLITSLRAPGVVEARTTGLDQEDECLVSQVLRDARAAAAGVTSLQPPHVAEIIEGLRVAWDTRHRRVPVADRDVQEVLSHAAEMRARARAKLLAGQREASIKARQAAKGKRVAALAARTAARVGLVDEEPG